MHTSITLFNAVDEKNKTEAGPDFIGRLKEDK